MVTTPRTDATDALASRITGELRDADLERAFLDDLAGSNHRVWFQTAIGIAVVFLLFSTVDLASLGPGPTWLALLAGRAVAAGAVAAAGRDLDRHPHRLVTTRGRIQLLGAQALMAAVALSAVALRPADALTNALSMTVFAIACVAMVPGRFRDQLAAGTAVAAGLVLVSVTRFDDPPLPTVPLVANLAGALLLGATIRSLLNRDQRRRWIAGRRLAEQLGEAAELRGELERLAREDPLTGAANRREFLSVLAAQLADRRGTVAVVVSDLDRFKAINDGHGHPIGDAVLVSVVAALRRVVRDQDVVARIGGEEFAVVLSGLDDTGAADAADRMRRAVVEQSPEGFEGRVTASFGVALHEPGESVESLLARADAAMYRAKRAGGNAVVAAEPQRQDRTTRMT